MQCPQCSTEFKPNNSRHTYCTDKCARLAQKKRWKQRKRFKETGLEPFKSYCKWCGNKFTRVSNNEKYCSDNCRLLSRLERLSRYKEAKRSEKDMVIHTPKLRSCVCCSQLFEAKYRTIYCSEKCKRNRTTLNARLNQYDLTEQEFSSLKQRANNACEICGVTNELHIDHCHTTGRVRGLLCRSCNHGLGNFKDDPTLLNKAIAYLN